MLLNKSQQLAQLQSLLALRCLDQKADQGSMPIKLMGNPCTSSTLYKYSLVTSKHSLFSQTAGSQKQTNLKCIQWPTVPPGLHLQHHLC